MTKVCVHLTINKNIFESVPISLTRIYLVLTLSVNSQLKIDDTLKINTPGGFIYKGEDDKGICIGQSQGGGTWG